MNFSCILLLALALFGAVSQAYIGSGAVGYGGVASGALGYGGLGSVGCNGLYENSCGGAGYGAGYGVGFEGAGYGSRCGCAPVCAPACASAAVCDSCQCMKTIVRPNLVERVPYACARRVQASACRSGLYSGAAYGGLAGSGVGGAYSGCMNGGYLY